MALLFQSAPLAAAFNCRGPAPLMVMLPVTPLSPLRSSMPEVVGVSVTALPAAVAGWEIVNEFAERTLTT